MFKGKFDSLKNSVFFLLISFISGCTTTNIDIVRPLFHEGDLSPRINISEKVDYSRFKTFTVFPYSDIDNNYKYKASNKYNMILFRLKCEMETAGYRYVDTTDSPDIYVTVNINNVAYNYDLPSYTMSIPVWNQGTTITSNVTTSGTFNSFGHNRGWGNYNGNSTIRTEVPGYYSNENIIIPGQTYTSNLPVVSVIAYKAGTSKPFWMGTSVGQTPVSDIVISSQFPLKAVISNFPRGTEKYKPSSSKDAGAGGGIFTVDGNNYFPVIFGVIKDSPADKAEVKQYDIVTKINGKSVANISERELFSLPEYDFDSNNTLTMTIFRLGKLSEHILYYK